jgi:hypothetical protein
MEHPKTGSRTAVAVVSLTPTGGDRVGSIAAIAVARGGLPLIPARHHASRKAAQQSHLRSTVPFAAYYSAAGRDFSYNKAGLA